MKAEPWASCDPQSPPVGKAGNMSLCLLNHAVHWRLGGNPVGLGILAPGVKHYRGVVKIVAGRAHCAVFHLRPRGLNGLSRKGPRLQLQIRIAGLSLLGSLTAALRQLWFLSSFGPSLNHPPGEQREAPQQEQQQGQRDQQRVEPPVLRGLVFLLAAGTVGGTLCGQGGE